MISTGDAFRLNWVGCSFPPSSVLSGRWALLRMRPRHFHYLPPSGVFHTGPAGLVIHLRKCCR